MSDRDPQLILLIKSANGAYIAGTDGNAVRSYGQWFDRLLQSGESGDEDTITGLVLYADLLESLKFPEKADCMRSIAYGSVLQNSVPSPDEIAWAAQAIAASAVRRPTTGLRTAAEKLLALLAEVPGNTPGTLIAQKADAYGAYLLVLLKLNEVETARSVYARYSGEVTARTENTKDSGLITIAHAQLRESLGDVRGAEVLFTAPIPPSGSVPGANSFATGMAHPDGDFPAIRRQVGLIRAAAAFYQRRHRCQELAGFVDRYAASWQIGPYLGEPARLYTNAVQCFQAAQDSSGAETMISRLRDRIRDEISARASSGQHFQGGYSNAHFQQAADTILSTRLRDAVLKESDVPSVVDGFQFAKFGPTNWSLAYLARLYAEPDPTIRRQMKEYLRAEAVYARVDALNASAAMYGAQEDQHRRATNKELERLVAEWVKYAGAAPSQAQIGEVHAPSGILTPAEIRAHLGQSDAVYFLATLDSGVYAAVMTRSGFALRRIALSAAEINLAVTRLRASLDPQNVRQAPDFDFVAAWQLYDVLFGPFTRELSGVTRIFWVPDGALTKLPPTVLITSQVNSPTLAEYRAVPWLARKFAFVTLPTITAIALNGAAVARTRAPSFVGIGDPVLGSHEPEDRNAVPEWRGQHSIDRVGLLPSLPETADELRQEASLIGGRTTLLLGAQATEPAVRAALKDDYQVVAFATHGLAAGDLKGLMEPALVVTPAPLEQRTSDNEGLLTESKIALMHIPADWVILSACNTAAPGLFGQKEPLSGLTRAFFIAGARSMLISHWPVDSNTAVRLTTGTIAKWRQGADQATALKWAIEQVIDDPEHPEHADPRLWAPFAVVGVTSD